jgi:uracil-DNA glycosylase
LTTVRRSDGQTGGERTVRRSDGRSVREPGDGHRHEPRHQPGSDARTPLTVQPPDRPTVASLAAAISACDRCPRLRAHCREIGRVRKREFATETYWARPVPGLGDPNARLLIIGLAPAAHGANRTGQLFTGDSSGSWLYEALHRYGWSNQPNSLRKGDGLILTDCWITAAAHCAPPDNKPTREELDRCRPYLEAELDLLTNVRVVLALGRISWEAWLRASGWWSRLSPSDRPQFAHNRETTMPDDLTLITSFHPSRQNTNTGKLTREMWYAVFERAKGAVER